MRGVVFEDRAVRFPEGVRPKEPEFQMRGASVGHDGLEEDTVWLVIEIIHADATNMASETEDVQHEDGPSELPEGSPRPCQLLFLLFPVPPAVSMKLEHVMYAIDRE